MQIDFASLRGANRKTICDRLRGEVMIVNDDKLPPPLKIKKSAVSLKDLKPSIIVNQLKKVLGISKEDADIFYSRGARSVDQLCKFADKFDLNVTQLNGCLYYDDLMMPIVEDEELKLEKQFLEAANDIKSPLLSTVIRSRPNGIHSRLEVLICVYKNECVECMQQIIDFISPYIPNEMAMIEINNNNSYSRVKCIILSESAEKHIILDLTIYQPDIHPYPVLRDIAEELLETGYILEDDGVWKNGQKLSYRKMLGRDNASSYEEIIMQ